MFQTRLFGNIEIVEDQIVTFPSGLVGWKTLKRFIFVDAENERPFRWMISLDDGDVSFLTLEPRRFHPTYSVAVQKEELEKLEILETTEVLVLCIITLDKDSKSPTANLQGPLLINEKSRIGKQLILVTGHYHTQHNVVAELAQLSSIDPSASVPAILHVKTN